MTTPQAPGWHTLWATWKGGRVGVRFLIVAQKGGRFFTSPVGVVAGPEETLFPFEEQCESDWMDLSAHFTEDAMEELMEIAGFSAHTLLKIATLAQQKKPPTMRN
jgi:hypothetical protein